MLSRSRRVFAVTMLGTVALLGVGGGVYFTQARKAVLTGRNAELEAITAFKVREISAWYRMLERDAMAISVAPGVAALAADGPGGPGDRAPAEHVRTWLRALSSDVTFQTAQLLDPTGRVAWFSFPEGSQTAPPNPEALARALRDAGPVLSMVHRDPQEGHIDLEVVAPVTVRAAGTDRTAAILVLHSNPRLYLFGLVAAWPVPSESAESLLVRREGDSVVFVSDLRNRPGSALRLRLPAALPDLPAAMVLQGTRGLVEGRDYRGMPVIAAVQPVTGTPWSIVTKIDRSEAYAPVRRIAWTTAGSMLLLAGLVAVALLAFDRARRLEGTREQLREARAQHLVAARFERLMRAAHDVIFLTSVDGRILDCNERAVEVLGYSREELLQLEAADLRDPARRDGIAEQFASAVANGSAVYETEHRRKDGRIIPVEISLSLIVAEPAPVLQAIVRDLTARRSAEAALRRSEERLRALIEASTESVFLLDADGRVVVANSAFAQRMGSTVSGVKGRLLRDLLPEDVGVSREVRFAEVIRTRAPVQFDDERFGRRIHNVMFPVLGPDGEVLSVGVFGLDVTERHRLETEVREYGRRMTTLLANLPGMAYRCRNDRAWTMEFVSEGCRELTGHAPEDLVANRVLSYEALIHPDDRERVWSDVQSALAAGRSFQVVYRIVTAAGEVRWVEERGRGVRDDRGELLVREGFVHDTTDRKRAEDELRRTEERFRTLILSAPLGISMSRGGTTFFANPAYVGMFGYGSVEEVIGMPLANVIAPEERERVLERNRRREQGESVLAHYETIGLRRGGARFPFATVVTRVDLPDGPATLGFFTDISDRRMAEERLFRSEQMLRLIIDAIPQRVFWKSDDLRYLGCNRPFAEDMGRDEPDEVVGRTDYDLVGPAFAEQYRADDLRVLESGESKLQFEELLDTGRGARRWVRTSKVPLRDRMGSVIGVLGSYEDITELKSASEERERLMAALERSNQDLEQFAYVASHDLQEPLRMVASYVELLAARYRGRLDAEADEFIHFAVDGAKRMQQLIQDLLHFSRVNTRGKPFTTVDVDALVATVLRDLAMAVEDAGATVTVGPLPRVQGDEPQLAMVFRNLVSNGLKFRAEAAPRVEITAERCGDEWRFAVRDNGIGIAERHRERIFLIFQRLHTRQEYPGTGIGLALCKRIVERHGGRIWVEAAPGGGSTFLFTIPADTGGHGAD